MELNIEKIKNNIKEALKNNELTSVKRLLDIAGNFRDDNDFKQEILNSLFRYGDAEMLKYFFENDPNLEQYCIDHKFIFLAIDYNNIPVIEYLINNELHQYQINENSIDYEYYPNILHYACEKGYIDVIKLLENHNLDLNSKDCYGRTCFFKAFMWGKIKTAELLYKLGADIFIESEHGSLPLFVCQTKNEIEYLLERGYTIDKKNEYNQNIAFFAKGELLIWCISKNLNYFQIDQNENNALHWACFYGDVEKVKQLLYLKLDPNSKDVNNWTALHIACIQGDLQNIIALLRAGADVSVVTNLNQTPLHLACKANHSNIVEVLLAFDAQMLLKDSFDKLPIEYTSSEIIEKLLGSLGYSIEPRRASYDTVQEAISNNDLTKIESLIAENFDFKSQLYKKDHPLFMSIYYKSYQSFQIFKMLLPLYNSENLCDVAEEVDIATLCSFFNIENLFDNQGRDILQYAIITKNKDVIGYLVENNFNVLHQDNKGNTALFYAVLNSDYNLIRRLIIKGSNINLENYLGQTPLDLAINEGNLNLIRFFKSGVFKMAAYFNLTIEFEEEDEEEWDEYDIQGNFHYYENPAQDPSQNPWIDVFGEGEEAEDAYWSTE